MAEQAFFYFGYGLLADRRFVQALFGRRLRLWEREDVAYGLKLKVLQREDLPQAIQDDATVSQGFRIYGAVEDSQGSRGRLKILRLDLSKEERAAVKALNFDNELYRGIEVADSFSASSNENGRWAGVGVRVKTKAAIDVLRDQSKGVVVDGMTYPYFLNDESASMALAREIHDKVLRPLKEGARSAGKER